MIEIKKSKYEVEENIKLLDETDAIIYEFDMQITDDELLEIKKILFSDAEKKKKIYSNMTLEERKKMEDQVEKEIKEKSDRFESICFKEHKEEFKKIAGEYKYNETVESVMNFFINFFVEKRMKPLNIGLMNLKKFMNNSIK